ncbi:thermostable hemolysin [Glaciecola sp. SC05]|uniref:thermostable hemolysin n=1 Tax=Glaciecola sp. SC05 TaxID=1987355 RepID=UPI0035288E71
MLDTNCNSSSNTNETYPFQLYIAKKPVNPATSMRVQVLRENHPDRKTANTFIQAGFKKSYGADVTVSMPIVIGLEKAGFKAALGMRSASDRLFIEQYLAIPIEQALGAQGYLSKRQHIAEIGHLYSNSSNFTLSLLIVTALLLHKQGFTAMVFTATAQLSNLFAKFGLTPRFIADADPSKLVISDQYWGTYYETQPKVMSLQLQDVKDLIAANRLFRVMSEQLMPQIDALVSNAKVAA